MAQHLIQGFRHPHENTTTIRFDHMGEPSVTVQPVHIDPPVESVVFHFNQITQVSTPLWRK